MEIIVDLPQKNAECPVWNPVQSLFYWVDIPRGEMRTLDPATGEVQLVHEAGEQIGALVVAEDGSLIQGLEKGKVQRWRAGAKTLICEGITEENHRRYNDAVVDPQGRVLMGTMPGGDVPARVYVFEPDGSYRLLLDNVGQSNGMAFSHDGGTLYHTDTKAGTISAFDYDPNGATVGDSREVVCIAEPNVVPDGLAIDSEGNLWSAHWGGTCLECYSPTGKLLKHLDVPVQNVSSVTFGGPDLDLMLVTTAGGDERDRYGELAGSVFCFTAGVRGTPPRLAKLGR